jgi:hypothetical protein
MKVSHGEGVVTHTGLESCGAARKSSVKALIRVRARRVLSRESTFLRGADALMRSGRPRPVHRYRETRRDSVIYRPLDVGVRILVVRHQNRDPEHGAHRRRPRRKREGTRSGPVRHGTHRIVSYAADAAIRVRPSIGTSRP